MSPQRALDRIRELVEGNAALREEIAERAQTEFNLRNEKEILQKIFDHIPIMIIFFDEHGRILLVNREWERKLGWPASEAHLPSLSAQVLADPEERERARAFIAESSDEWKEFSPIAKNGSVVDSAWCNIRLSDGSKISIGQDITERKLAERRLRTNNEQLRALSAKVLHAREEERTHMSHEIHDALGSSLTWLKWELETIGKDLGSSHNSADAEELHRRLATMTNLTENAIDTVRRIASELRPGILDDQGLAEALQWQAQQFESRTGIKCHFECHCENLDLNRETTTALFRVVQEALTNILRHARASRVTIEVESDADALVLRVADNGRGITESEKSGYLSLGLLGMQERAHQVNGTIEIVGRAGIGTIITVRIETPRRT